MARRVPISTYDTTIATMFWTVCVMMHESDECSSIW